MMSQKHEVQNVNKEFSTQHTCGIDMQKHHLTEKIGTGFLDLRRHRPTGVRGYITIFF